MTCRDVQRKISAYLDGEMDAPNRDAFFDHVQDCAGCRDAMGDAVFMEAHLAGMMKQRMEAPAAIRYNVLSAISREKAREASSPLRDPVWRRLAWRPAAAFATVLTLAGAGWRAFNVPVVSSLSRVPTATDISPASKTPAPDVTAPKKAPRPMVAAAAPKPEPVPAAPRVVTEPAPERAVPVRAVPVPAAPKPSAAPREATRVEPAPAESRPEPVAPAAPSTDLVAALPVDEAVGSVTYIWAPDNVLNGRFLSRGEGADGWIDAPNELPMKAHLQSAEDTVVSIALKDGTLLKSNHDTEFVVLRSPTADDPTWGIRLVRGELWVRTDAPVEVSTPSMRVSTEEGEFSVRSMDGQDASAISVVGRLTCHNESGSRIVEAGFGTSALAEAAPKEPFAVADASDSDPASMKLGQLGWAYKELPAYNPLNNGGTQA